MTVEQWTAKRRSETVSRQQQAAIEEATRDLQQQWRDHPYHRNVGAIAEEMAKT